MPYIEFKNVCKEYKMGEITIKALDKANFSIEKGELVVIVGPSGAGKTTTLNILGGMDSATSGKVIVDNKEVTHLKNKELIKYRRDDIGFVFQFYNLIQNLTAIENVEIATQLCKNALDPEKTLEKVNELTGLNIKYYMVIDNQALIKLVDVIGGVDFYVPIDMVYDDPSQDLHINLKEGQQKLDGDKAEQLLRYRHGNLDKKTGKYLGTYPEEYGGNDYGRMRTQREFMIETVKQTIQAKNILKVKEIIDIAYEYVETNLSISVIKDYVPYAVSIDVNNIQSAVIPGGSYGPPTYSLWYFIPDKKETAELMKELYGSGDDDTSSSTTENTATNTTNTSKTNTTTNSTTNNTSTNTSSTSSVSKTEAGKIKVEILNGSNSSATLTAVKKALTAKGYKVTKTTNTTTTGKTTIINKSDVDTKITDNIKDILGVGTVSSSSVSSSNVDITIIIGEDYK